MDSLLERRGPGQPDDRGPFREEGYADKVSGGESAERASAGPPTYPSASASA